MWCPTPSHEVKELRHVPVLRSGGIRFRLTFATRAKLKKVKQNKSPRLVIFISFGPDELVNRLTDVHLLGSILAAAGLPDRSISCLVVVPGIERRTAGRKFADPFREFPA